MENNKMLEFWITATVMLAIAALVLWPFSIWFGDVLTREPPDLRQLFFGLFSTKKKPKAAQFFPALKLFPTSNSTGSLSYELFLPYTGELFLPNTEVFLMDKFQRMIRSDFSSTVLVPYGTHPPNLSNQGFNVKRQEFNRFVRPNFVSGSTADISSSALVIVQSPTKSILSTILAP